MNSGWDYFYTFFWKTGLTLDSEALNKTSLSRFKTFFALVLLFSMHYNFTYFFLGKRAGFPLDDAWIHMTYGKNLFLYGAFSFDGIKLSTGATSFLWPSIVSVFYSFSPVLLVPLVHIFNMCAFFILICIWYQIATYMFLDETLAFLTAFFLPFCGNLLWIVFSGMESIFFLAVGITAIYSFGKRHYISAGILSAVLVITRPEGLALPLAFMTIEVYRFFRKSEMNHRDSMFLFVPPIIMFLLYMGMNFYINGHFISSSFLGRRWLYHYPEHTPFFSGIINGAKHLSGMWLKQIVTYSSGLGWIGNSLLFNGFSGILKGLGAFLFLSGMMFYVISFFMGIKPKYSFDTTKADTWGFLKKNEGWKRMEVPLLLWTIYHNLSYSFFLPHIGHGGRYQPINLIWMVVFFVLSIRGWGEILSFLFSKHEKKIKYSLSFFFAGIIVIQFWLWVFVYQGCVSHINKVHIKAAKWVENNIPPDEKIAAFDIGAMGFFSGRDVLDMGGLVNPECVSYLFKNSIVPYLKSEKIKYMAMVERPSPYGITYRTGVCQADGEKFNLTPLYSVKLDNDENFHRPPTGIGYPEIKIYKVDWRS